MNRNPWYLAFQLSLFILGAAGCISSFEQQEIDDSVARDLTQITYTEEAPTVTPSRAIVKTVPQPTVVLSSIEEPQTLTPDPTITSARPPETLEATVPPITPTNTQTSTATSNNVLIASNGIDRTCPNPIPTKPEYRHYYLSGQEWPQAAEEPTNHLWLSKPLPGGGRLLYTDWLPYGYDAGGRYLIHNGIDAAEPQGTPLLAAASGIVVVAGSDENHLYGWRCDWYGHLVAIELDDQWLGQPVYILYGHVQNITVTIGQRVDRGQQIAEVGVGGAAQLPHMHFEVRVGTNEFSSSRNPFLWLRPPETRGVLVGRLVDPLGRPWQGVAIAAVGQSEDTTNITTWSYLDDPQHLINPDEEMAENFVIPDLLPGSYVLYVELQGQQYRVPVEIESRQISRAEIITEAFKTPTPEIDQFDQEPATETPPDG